MELQTITDLQIVDKPVKKTRNRVVKSSNTVDVKELVQKLTNQAAIITWIDAVVVPEMPEWVSSEKGCRDIIIQFQKAVEQAKNDGIVNIQKL